MNKENLQRMADHIRTIPQEMFDIGTYFRKGDIKTPECNSIGCGIGHCTVLDAKNVIKNYTAFDGSINFDNWSRDFAGLNTSQLLWCFSDMWKFTDNTPEGTALRIEWLKKYGLPENGDEQMYGEEPLCYR